MSKSYRKTRCSDNIDDKVREKMRKSVEKKVSICADADSPDASIVPLRKDFRRGNAPDHDHLYHRSRSSSRFFSRDTSENQSLHQVSQILRVDEVLLYSIDKFNRHRLQKWLFTRTNFHNFSKDFDTHAFPKEKYVELVAYRERYYINISDSNVCLAHAAYIAIPTDLSPLRPCKLNRRCDRVMGMLNLLFPRVVRRCYIRSATGDMENIENMCAFMYREAVYIARRGFFARDLFLEHLALCSVLGYEEFHRRKWYHKAARMIDEDGFMTESHNFRFNYTTIMLEKLSKTKDKKTLREMKKRGRQQLLESCEIHPMTMLQVVLAHAIRHALHYIPVNYL